MRLHHSSAVEDRPVPLLEDEAWDAPRRLSELDCRVETGVEGRLLRATPDLEGDLW